MDDIRKKFYTAGYIVFLLLLIYAGGIVFKYVQNIVVLVVASIFFAYILLPAVRFFEKPIVIPKTISLRVLKKRLFLRKSEKEITLMKKGKSRLWSIIIVYLLLLSILAIFLAYFIPKIVQEFRDLVRDFPTLVALTQAKANELIKIVEPKLPPNYREMVTQNVDQVISKAASYISSAAAYSINIIQGIISAAVAILVIPLFTFYMLLDMETFKKTFWSLVPDHRRDEISDLTKEIDKALGRYVRGQILVGVFVGIAITIALLILGIDYAFLIGLVSGILNFVPYLGVIASLVPSLTLALIEKGFWGMVITFLVLEFIQVLEGQVITPSIMGEVVGLPPLIIIIALVIGAQALGLLGMLIAVPVAAILRVTVLFYINRHVEREKKDDNPVI